MKFGLAQINTGADVTANAAKVREYTLRASDQGVQAVIFPEAAMSAFGSDLKAAADEHGQWWTDEMAKLASEAGIPVIVGEFERSGDKVINYLSAYSPDGRRTSYAKIHLYDAFGYQESSTVQAGDEIVTLDIAGTTVGLGICYDVRFPKLFAELSRAGAQIAIVAASWGAGPGKVRQWRTLAQARALDSNMSVIALGQADPEVTGVDVPAGAPTGVGHSVVSDPFGEIVAELDGAESLISVDIDPSVSEKAADSIPVLMNARLGY